MSALTVGSLFSGIGGLDLGLERAGMKVVWQSEIDPYCSQVLKKHWPDVPNLGDVKRIEWESVERVDLICGGYPCPAFSQAAQGRNVAENLWPWMRDAVAVLRPRFVLLENVAAHLAAGVSRMSWLTSMRSGMTRNGRLFPRAPWVHHIHDAGCSLLPTPTAAANQCSPSMKKWPGCRRLQEMVGTGGSPPPTTFERMMGFPIGWTDLEP